MIIDSLTPAIGAELKDVDFSGSLSTDTIDTIYQALIDNCVIFIRGADISPATHLEFACQFGQLDEPHPTYPHVEGFENIMLLENDSGTPPDTNSWHTDLTYKAEQPFASILVARDVPDSGGDTLWSSNYAAFNRLAPQLQEYLSTLEAVHDFGDFRNNFACDSTTEDAASRLSDGMVRFGQTVRPLIDTHPVSGKKFLNFNEAFVSHIVGMTTNESSAIKNLLANHMNKPEDQMRWRWRRGDLAMWDNRVTMHYAVADYLPQHRCMNRITVVADSRLNKAHAVA